MTLRLRACTGGFLFVILRHENKNTPYHETESLHTDFGVLRDAGSGADGLRDCHAGGILTLLSLREEWDAPDGAEIQENLKENLKK